jgi:hypothetical protein
MPPNDDCDDADSDVFPGHMEVCDGKDNDCNTVIDDGLSVDADNDGHYTLESCLQPADDCDDSDPDIGYCNTPPLGDDPVVVEDESGEVQVTFPSVTTGGDTSISPIENCQLDEPAGYTMNLSATCYDIHTTADFNGMVEVCITFNIADIPDPPGVNGLIMLSCDAGGGNCTPLETSSLTVTPPTAELCAWTDHFSLFSIAVEADTDSDFDGYNDSDDNCPDDFNPSQSDLDSDGIGDVCDHCIDMWDPGNSCSGTGDYDQDGMPDQWEIDHGLDPEIYNPNQDSDSDTYDNIIEFRYGSKPNDPGSIPITANFPMRKGFNLMGAPTNTGIIHVSAFVLLEDMGGEAVVKSIQQFNPATGKFDTAAYVDGNLAGVDFALNPKFGYIVYMHTDITGFNP